ncbi:MAG: hypothetical protein KC978_22320, partial [Candidatus Omnitrophica bacterium]|nr:hypothetical protein [Candidatus Omnitrophota bacterium]
MTEIRTPSYLPQTEGQKLEEFFQRTRLGWIDYRTARDLIRLSGLEEDSETLYPLLLALFLSLNEGSLCLPLTEERLTDRLSVIVPQDLVGTMTEKILEGLNKRRWNTLIGEGSEGFIPLRIHSEGAQRFLYFQKYHAKEKQLAENFGKLLDFPPEEVDVEQVQKILLETLEE